MARMYVRKSYQNMVSDSIERSYSGIFIADEIDDTTYLVRNLEKNTIYKVSVDDEMVLDCDCPHHILFSVLLPPYSMDTDLTSVSFFFCQQLSEYSENRRICYFFCSSSIPRRHLTDIAVLLVVSKLKS